MSKLAAIYARVSSAGQGDENKISLKDQVDRCRTAAEAEGYAVPPHLVFRDKVSGKKGEEERPGYASLMHAVRNGECSKVFFWRVDRLGRDQVEIGRALQDMERANVAFHSLDDPDLANRLLRGITAAIADHEADQIRRRTKRGRDAARARGIWTQGMAPYGHRRREDGTLEIDPIEAMTARRILAWIKAGKGRVTIAHRLNGEGIMPPLVKLKVPGRSRELRLRTNDPRIGSDWTRLHAFIAETGATLAGGRKPRWGESTVDRLVHNPILHGISGGRPVTISPAPLLTEEQHKELEALVSGRHRKGRAPRNRYLLTGMLTCGTCGRGMTVHIGGHGRGEPVLYWICSGRRNGTGCEHPSARMDKINPYVAGLVNNYLADRLSRKDFKAFLEAHSRTVIGDLQHRHDELRAELAKAKLERERVTKRLLLLDDLDDSAIADIKSALGAAGERIAAAETELRDVAAQLAKAQEVALVDEAAHRDVAMLADYGAHIPEAVPDEPELPDPREVLRVLVRRAIVRPDAGVDVELDRSDDALAEVVRILTGWAQRIYKNHRPALARLERPYPDKPVVGCEDNAKPLA